MHAQEMSKGLKARRRVLRAMGAGGAAGLLGAASWQARAAAPVVRVAVAANMASTAQRMARVFEQTTPYRVQMAVGSTGKLHAQILHGAPYDLLLAADGRTPAALERSLHAVGGTRFTYAVGRLALWSADPAAVDDSGQVLRQLAGQRLARADPKVSPYGVATVQTLQSLGVHLPREQWVEGESIAQAHQFVASGGVRWGFVAWSHIQWQGRLSSGSAWRVPAHLHGPIRQDAVLLTAASQSPGARAFWSFMRSQPAQEMLREAGYETA